MKPLRIALSSLLIFTFGCGGASLVAPTHASLEQTGITQTLITLLDRYEKVKLSAEDYTNPSLDALRTLRTPAGYRLFLRYYYFGFALIEALKISRDPELKRRMIEMVQWSRKPEVRAEAILTLSTLSDPAHKKYFKEALLDSNIGLRFCAVEALQIWNQPESIELLKMALERAWSPLIKIYAAQALLTLGDESGLPVLWKGLDHNSWVIRAMSARYLGDFANPKDYTTLVSYLNKESRNDYVVAELAIAALKLISKKGEKVSYSPASKGWRENDEVRYTVGKSGVVELEPLIIVPPRLRIPASLQVAVQVDNQLLRLISERLDERLDPEQAEDPVLINELNGLVTPSGMALKLRYSELSYLVIEGLAGSTDLRIRSTLEKLATDSPKLVVRSAALVSLAYSRDPNHIYLIQNALNQERKGYEMVRFAGMEAIEEGRYQQALSSLMAMSNREEAPALQLYAIQIFAKFGDPSAHHLLLNRINDPDWVARAMAFWYLGRYGDNSDYTFVLSRLGTEVNPFVQAEIALAALRLAPL